MSDVGDWVSIQRRLFDEESEFHGDGMLLALWVTLIGRANWRDGTKRLAGQRKIVRRGQLATSYEKLAAALGISVKAVRTRLAYLEKGHAISCEKGTHGTVITILNYDQYQTRPRERGTPSDAEGARDGHAMGTPGATSRTREQGNKETINPPLPPLPENEAPSAPAEPLGGRADLEARAKAMGRRIANAAARGQIETLSDEDARTLLRHYRTSERAQAGISRLWMTRGVGSPEAFTAAELARSLIDVLDRPDLDPPPPEPPRSFTSSLDDGYLEEPV